MSLRVCILPRICHLHVPSYVCISSRCMSLRACLFIFLSVRVHVPFVRMSSSYPCPLMCMSLCVYITPCVCPPCVCPSVYMSFLCACLLHVRVPSCVCSPCVCPSVIRGHVHFMCNSPMSLRVYVTPRVCLFMYMSLRVYILPCICACLLHVHVSSCVCSPSICPSVCVSVSCACIFRVREPSFVCPSVCITRNYFGSKITSILVRPPVM